MTNGKFALLLCVSILLFTSCKQSGSQNSESIADQVSNLVSSSPCDKFIGKYSRQQTASSITTTSNIEIKKDQDFYKLFISTNSTTTNRALELSTKMMNDRNKAIFPVDGFVCTCNQKGNIELSIEGKTIESMIDNSGNLIYGGLTFYKTNNENKSEETEEVTEETLDKTINKPIKIFTEKDVEAMESTNRKLISKQFVGEWKQNMNESTDQKEYSLLIKEINESKIELTVKEIYASTYNQEDIFQGKHIGNLDAQNRYVIQTKNKDIKYYIEIYDKESGDIGFYIKEKLTTGSIRTGFISFHKK